MHGGCGRLWVSLSEEICTLIYTVVYVKRMGTETFDYGSDFDRDFGTFVLNVAINDNSSFVWCCLCLVLRVSQVSRDKTSKDDPVSFHGQISLDLIWMVSM